MAITFKDEKKKKITKEDLPSSIQRRKLSIQFDLQVHSKIKIGAVVRTKQDITCHSLIGDVLGVDKVIIVPEGTHMLLVGIVYCNLLKHMMLQFVYDGISAYVDYDTMSRAGGQEEAINELFEVSIASIRTNMV
jgi:hypothetical protein